MKGRHELKCAIFWRNMEKPLTFIIWSLDSSKKNLTERKAKYCLLDAFIPGKEISDCSKLLNIALNSVKWSKIQKTTAEK